MSLPAHKERLRDGLPTIAVNIGGRNTDVMKALTEAGAHVAFIDCERTGIGIDAATELIRSALIAGIAPIIRSWSKDPAVLVQYLDRQAAGLVVPHINTAQDTADVVELVRYACGKKAAEKTVIVQIETVEAVQNLEAIMAVEGVDAYLIGPNDLAYSMCGERGAETAEITATIERVCATLKASGKRFGMPASWQQLTRFQSLGATFLYFPIEWLLKKALQDLNKSLGIAH